MSSDAQALVRQLTENPEVLESMQHMLSLLRANPPKMAQGSTNASAVLSTSSGTSRSAPRVRPPRSGYTDDAPPHAGADYHAYHDDTLSGTPSPMPARAEAARRGGRRSSASGRGPRGASPPPSTARNSHATHPFTTAAAAESAELLAASRQLLEAQRRITELERELQRTTQRVESLSEVVQKQKGELQVAQDRHALELEETRHAYDAVVRRKDEVQEEALRQVMKSRQLMLSAAKYEAVVAAKQREKENVSSTNNNYNYSAAPRDFAGAGKGGHELAAGLTASGTAINARHSAHLFGSGVKRERLDEDDGQREGHPTTPATFARDAYDTHPQQAPPSPPPPPSKRTASDSWGTPTARGRSRPERRAYGSDAKTESPEFITSPTPIGKASTALVGGARTQSRSARKRRTPRTPSLTNADRIVSTQNNNNNTNNYAHGNSNSIGAAPQRYLPGTSSLKLDSPTPVVSTTWTAGRSLTTSLTPPPPPPPPAPLTLTAGSALNTTTKPYPQHQQQQQHPPPSTRTPLTQRAAGRLAPPSAAAAPQLTLSRAVPNTRSGTSSVAAEGPTRSPSPVNPKRGNPGPRRFIFTGLKDGELQKLSAAIIAVGEDAAVLASDLDEVPPRATTHIVLRGTPRSVKALCGVVSGKWLVSPEYIANSQESGFWLDEMEEGGLRIFPPPLQGQRFLLTIEHDGIRGKLAQVIEYGGGEVLPVSGGRVAQDVVVITSGDDLLRYATEGHM